MKKAIFLLVLILFSAFAVAEQSLDEILEEQNLAIQVWEIVVDSAKEADKDTGTVEALLSEYRALIAEAESASTDTDKWAKLQEAFAKAPALQSEIEALGMDDQKELSEKEKVEKAIEDFEIYVDLIDKILEEIKSQGRDVAGAESELKVFKDLYDEMKSFYDQGEYHEANKNLVKLYIQSPKLKEQLDKYEEFEDKDKGKSVKEKVEGHLENMYYSFQVLEIVIDAAEEQGVDVSTVKELYNEIMALYEDAESKANMGDYDSAWKSIIKLFTKAIDFQKELKKISPDDPRTNEEKVKDSIAEWEKNSVNIRIFLGQAKAEGIDTSKVDSLFATIESLMRDAQGLADKGDYDAAWNKLMQVFIQASAFQQEFKLIQKAMEKPEEKIAEIASIIEEFDLHYEVIQVFIEAQEKEGNDVTEIKELTEEIKLIIDEIRDIYKDDYKTAWKKMMKGFVIANKLQKEFEKFEFKAQDIKDSIDKAKSNFPKAEEVISALEKKGANVQELRSLLKNIKTHVTRADDYYSEGNYKKASKELQTAFNLGEQLEKISGKLIKEVGE